eukprot:GHVO01068318.1.p1 GENE.GHVO01068318.1~~GHVO01068318.1.p1  ORF type:complete len:181 (+),score=21.41 GHVO01068318.1:258-800(+)
MPNQLSRKNSKSRNSKEQRKRNKKIQKQHRRISAPEIYKAAMHWTPHPDTSRAPIKPDKNWEDSPAWGKNFSDKFNGTLCLCPYLDHCSKQAILHPEGCGFCHGPPDHPKVIRYYPCDLGWFNMRATADALREAAGLPAMKEVKWRQPKIPDNMMKDNVQQQQARYRPYREFYGYTYGQA